MTTSNASPRFQPPAPWLFLGTGVVGLAAILVAMGSRVRGRGRTGLDDYIRQVVEGHGSRRIEAIAQAVSHASTPAIVYAAAGLVALLLLWRRGWRAAVANALVPLLAYAAHNSAKAFFDRTRPPGGLSHESSSFPSGHATTSAAVLVLAAYVLWRERLLPPAAAVAMGAAAPVIVAWSRVRLDEHWTTDVLAGWCLGLALAGVCGLLHRRLRPVDPANERPDFR